MFRESSCGLLNVLRIFREGSGKVKGKFREGMFLNLRKWFNNKKDFPYLVSDWGGHIGVNKFSLHFWMIQRMSAELK